MINNFIRCDYTPTIGSINLVIPLDEVKNYLKVDATNTEDDDLIKQLIKAAACTFEAFTGQTLLTVIFEVLCTGFPRTVLQPSSHSGFICNFNCIEIRRFPLQQVLLIEFLENDVFVIWPTTEFGVNFGSSAKYPFIFALEEWPIPDCNPRPVKMLIEAGYGDDSTTIPDAIKVGLLQHIAFLYENRGDCACPGSGVSSLPMAAKLLYSKFIIYKLQNESLC